MTSSNILHVNDVVWLIYKDKNIWANHQNKYEQSFMYFIFYFADVEPCFVDNCGK